MIKRKKLKKNFTVISNAPLQDDKLSCGAKGIWAYLMSLPDDWVIYKTELHRHFKDGRAGVISKFNELVEAGYIEEVEIFEKGLRKLSYTVHECRFTSVAERTSLDGCRESTSTKDELERTNKQTPIVPKGDEFELPKEKDSSTAKEDPIPYDEIMKAWNACEAFASMRGMNSNRKRTLRARWKNPDFRDGWKEALHAAHRSPFLRGEVKPSAGYRQFRMTFDWFINERNFQKIIEGNFDDESSKPYTPEPLNRDQRDWYAENGKAQEYLDRRTDADERVADKKYFFEKHGLTLN